MVLMAMMALVLGIFYGLSGMEWRLPDFLAAHSGWILYVLMFSVGISVGMHHGLLQKLREHHIKILIIPAGIIIASAIGGVFCSWITGYPLGQSIAAASGLGYYSFTGVAMNQIAGPEMGGIGFLSNLMREIFSFIVIPFAASRLNGYACIASAGATSEDTTLPMMIRYTDEETVVLSVINGILCSAAVPVLVPVFCGLS